MDKKDCKNHYWIISMSGGKDSTATWLYLSRELGIENYVCVFADTGFESELTYEYLEYLKSENCPLVYIQGMMQQVKKKWRGEGLSHLFQRLTMENLSIHKKRFPSATARFCTTHLKHYPFRSYVYACMGMAPPTPFFSYPWPEPVGKSVQIASGVRGEESRKRAQMEPYQYDEFMQCGRWLPIHKWTSQQVFKIHDKYNIRPNPLYKKGCCRVGCFPCHLARKTELASMSLFFPGAFKNLKKVEDRVSEKTGQIHTYFSAKTTPKKFRSEVDPKSNVRIPTALDVEKWALGIESEQLQIEWEDGEDLEAEACSSFYGLCE